MHIPTIMLCKCSSFCGLLDKAVKQKFLNNIHENLITFHCEAHFDFSPIQSSPINSRIEHTISAGARSIVKVSAVTLTSVPGLDARKIGEGGLFLIPSNQHTKQKKIAHKTPQSIPVVGHKYCTVCILHCTCTIDSYFFLLALLLSQ